MWLFSDNNRTQKQGGLSALCTALLSPCPVLLAGGTCKEQWAVEGDPGPLLHEEDNRARADARMAGKGEPALCLGV